MALLVDGPAKVAFATTQALAARALADAVPNPYAKRLAARGVFVAIDSLISLARQSRNLIKETKANKSDLADLKQALNDLADRDWGPYEEIRDRIGAHRQPVGGGDDTLGWAAANELWAQVDAPLVGVLCEDVVAIDRSLQVLTGRPATTEPALSGAAQAALAAAPDFNRARAGLAVATGSFGETQEGTVTPLQGGTIGERLRQISDTIDGWEFYAAVVPHVAAEQPFLRAAISGAIIETAGLVELVFDVPEGRAPANRFAPLVELIPSTYPELADLQSAPQRSVSGGRVMDPGSPEHRRGPYRRADAPRIAA